jgi:hypothetical protein
MRHPDYRNEYKLIFSQVYDAIIPCSFAVFDLQGFVACEVAVSQVKYFFGD